MKMKVKLNTSADVTKFSILASMCNNEVWATGKDISRKQDIMINAKSMQGLYDLNLDEPINVEFFGNVPSEVKEGMKNFIVN